MGGTVAGVARLIVGVSGSPGSLRALRYGEGLARAQEAVLIPVMAWEPPGGDRAERIQPSGDLRREWHKLAYRRLRDAPIAVWGEVPDDPLVQPHVVRGPAGWVLVNLAGRRAPRRTTGPAPMMNWLRRELAPCLRAVSSGLRRARRLRRRRPSGP
jgi:hypothetical protein